MINANEHSVSQEFDERTRTTCGRKQNIQAFEANIFDALGLELKHSQDYQNNESGYAEYEVDSVEEDFGELFRLWNGKILLGTFYETSQGWKTTPYYLCRQYIKAELDLAQNVDNSDRAVSYIKSLYEGINKNLSLNTDSVNIIPLSARQTDICSELAVSF